MKHWIKWIWAGIFTATLALAAGKIQNEDVKSLTELQTAGGSTSQLINDTKIYVTANSINTQLSTAITNGTLGSGGTAPSAASDLKNVGLAATVSASAMTIALKQADGSTNCSTGTAACLISFRNATLGTGSYTQASVTGALSTVISSGSTAGASNGVQSTVYVYAISNSGTPELAWSGSNDGATGTLINTTAEGGAGAADSISTIYSTTARTSVPIRLIGRIRSTQATAGTWATTPSEISIWPFQDNSPRSIVAVYNKLGAGSSSTTIARWANIQFNQGTAISYADSASLGGTFTINENGLYCTEGSQYSGSTIAFAITLNSAELSTACDSLTNQNSILCFGRGASANTSGTCSWCGPLLIGDVVRMCGDGTNGDNYRSRMWISKLSN